MKNDMFIYQLFCFNYQSGTVEVRQFQAQADFLELLERC